MDVVLLNKSLLGIKINNYIMGVIKTFSEFINESIWSDIQDRSSGETIREEDMITTNKDLRNKILELHIEQGGGETLDVSSLANCIKCDDFSYIFRGFKKVKHIIGLEDWDVSKVTNMKGMFYNCENFNSDLSKWNVSNVENMYGMFWGCINFNSDLSKWNVRKVKNIGDVFYNCKSLKQIPSWYMKYNRKINESIWSDMQDRSAGDVVRKEDDINHLDYVEFFTYLTEHYKPKSKKDNEKIGGRTPITNMNVIEIFIPIEYIDDRIKTLMIVISKKDNSIVSIATSQTLFDKYVNLERTLSNNYTLNPSKNSPRVYIKSNKKLTNNTIVDLINTFIAAVDNPILERVS